jgi:hypothetical protein
MSERKVWEGLLGWKAGEPAKPGVSVQLNFSCSSQLLLDQLLTSGQFAFPASKTSSSSVSRDHSAVPCPGEAGGTLCGPWGRKTSSPFNFSTVDHFFRLHSISFLVASMTPFL